MATQDPVSTLMQKYQNIPGFASASIGNSILPSSYSLSDLMNGGSSGSLPRSSLYGLPSYLPTAQTTPLNASASDYFNPPGVTLTSPISSPGTASYTSNVSSTPQSGVSTRGFGLQDTSIPTSSGSPTGSQPGSTSSSATPSTPSYQDLLSQQTDLNSKIKAIDDQISYAQSQYASTHFGGMSGDQFASYLGSLNSQKQPLQQQLDQLRIQILTAQQNQQYQDQTAQQVQEQQATQQNLLGQLPGIESQVGQDLLGQQNIAYQQIQPLIEERLNSLGLLQSGALPEAQAKAFQNLEGARQGELANFDINARNLLQLQYPMQITAGQVSQQQSALQNALQLGQANVTRQFQDTDIANQMALQQQLQLQALDEARQAQQSQQQSALYGSLIGAGGSILGGALGGPLGSRLFKNTSNNGQNYPPGTTVYYPTENIIG